MPRPTPMKHWTPADHRLSEVSASNHRATARAVTVSQSVAAAYDQPRDWNRDPGSRRLEPASGVLMPQP